MRFFGKRLAMHFFLQPRQSMPPPLWRIDTFPSYEKLNPKYSNRDFSSILQHYFIKIKNTQFKLMGAEILDILITFQVLFFIMWFSNKKLFWFLRLQAFFKAIPTLSLYDFTQCFHEFSSFPKISRSISRLAKSLAHYISTPLSHYVPPNSCQILQKMQLMGGERRPGSYKKSSFWSQENWWEQVTF